MNMDACQYFIIALTAAFLNVGHIILADSPVVSEEFFMKDLRQIPESLDHGIIDDLFLHNHNDNHSLPISNVTERCNAIMHHFAVQGGNFTRCMLGHARPFRLCEKCIQHYTLFTELYEALIVNDKPCSQFLLLADRVQVVTSTYRSFKQIWSSSYCDQCFVSNSVRVNSTTGVVTYNVTADAKLLREMQDNVTRCFVNSSHDDVGNKTSAVCTECRAVYQQMNKEYIRQKNEIDNGICMDLADMMNHTRLMWSNIYGCKPTYPSAVGVIIITTLACLSVFFFYVVMPYAANIRPHNIFKAKRMATGTSRYGSLSEQDINSSLPSFPGSDSLSTEVRRRENLRDKILAHNGGPQGAGESS